MTDANRFQGKTYISIRKGKEYQNLNNKIYLINIQQQTINKTFRCHYNLFMYVL